MSFQPTLRFIREFIKKSEVKPPPEESKVQDWLSCKDLPHFLDATASDWVLVHLSTEDYFLNSFTIDASHLDQYRSKDAPSLNFPIQSGIIGYGYGWSGETKKYFYEPNSESGLGDSQMWPLFFHRSFDGYKKNERDYYEISQEFIHFADLHWVKEKTAFCTLNDVGDIEEKILLIDEPEFSAIMFERSTLELYLLYRSHFLCRFFEIKRAMPNANWMGNTREEPIHLSSHDKNGWISLRPNKTTDLTKACDLVRASHVVLPTRTIDEIESPEEEYATYIIHDWKNDRVVEWSCDRESLNSYFEDTGKPFETSPAYFKPDVLLKYKMEPEKYDFRERSIYCRGALSLKTYDINDEGQVHTYICYLRNLPYREQLHWKQYNEKPKGTISARAFKTDFEAAWVTDYNPLELIKDHFRNFPPLSTASGEVSVWHAKEDLDSLFNKIHFVSAGKLSEYKDFLLALTILVIDGFDAAALSKLASSHPKYSEQSKSIGCLKLVLSLLGLNEENADAIVRPLRILQEKRSKYGGHGGSTPEFDLVEDCRATLQQIEEAVNALLTVLQSSKLK